MLVDSELLVVVMPLKEVVKANIDRVKQITDKPFGVNIMLLSPFADDIVDLVIEEGVKVVTTGAGNPGKYMERFHEAGITVIPVIPSVALAKRMEKTWSRCCCRRRYGSWWSHR